MKRFSTSAEPRAAARRRARDGAPRIRAAVAAAGVLVICGAPFAGAATGDNLREGVRNGTTTSETEIIANIRTTTAAKGGFAMRMSNLSSTGGGFINGCRASAAATSKPCYRASNLSTGRAFEFNSNSGPVVGTITSGAPGARPFTTNATAVATGLNADRVDNLDAAQIVATARVKAGLAAETADKAADSNTLDGVDSTAFVQKTELLWALTDLDAAGATVVRSNGATGASRTGIGDFVITFNRDISACVIQATPADANGSGPPGPGSAPAYTVAVDNEGTDSVQLFTLDEAGAAIDPGSTDGATVSVMC